MDAATRAVAEPGEPPRHAACGAGSRDEDARDTARSPVAPQGAGAQAPADFLPAGNPRPVLQAAHDALACGEPAVLAVVLETDGSTYARPGTLALFAGDTQAGWLSGGCLEPELNRRAAQAAAAARIGWMEIDTRDDGALFSGTALGCRGRLRIALLPLALLPGIREGLAHWLAGGCTLQLALSRDGEVALRTARGAQAARLPCDAPAWRDAARRWTLPLPRPPEALLLGAGPETPVLVGLLRDLGWRVAAAEPRPRWQPACAAADDPAQSREALARSDAALVMHHDFERDLAALDALARTPVAFVGLLGPPRRRDDLLTLLDPDARAALAPRLHAPVGLDLGGQGPEAIALSIAAQLQGWRATHAAATGA